MCANTSRSVNIDSILNREEKTNLNFPSPATTQHKNVNVFPQLGHSEGLTSLAFSPDGNFLSVHPGIRQ